ncbi:MULTISPECIES: ABC-F family ATP-binding cassette domain-containing protein [unclassified Bacillus (in: firmicutes)]|uniref:ABC-F family ATP-binding cassette domain-containing protein n=1 Tax=unclassified Bacillus (in: firmicutes) TaxID=185979 RepID=UPI0008EEC837|nr:MULTISPECIES: ABC-F family ATP-binding cassette domain-containing protein [unclassified Bacillus (in: firmicutes)]SFA86292.1 ATPase components of ABC transporters with duplicated ATPase domains [Bacillus sp. UNCCL13]SFQ83644.1 ATPase components of ABC transporters with duplicated ATPase domains [Bacillus sp. cl95]
MSILTVKDLSHGFGDRAIFDNVSFRLLRGEHIALIGANGEGKSTFMNIITGQLQPDDGKVEWSRNQRVGYLDQHAVLQKGFTIRDVLKTAFQYLFDIETNINDIYGKMGDVTPEEMDKLLEEVGTLQDMLTNNDFYVIDAKVEEVARGLGLDEVGLDKDVHDLSGGQRTKVLLAKLLLEKPDILLLDEPTNYLDEQHIEWLRRYLQEYENAFVLISHDIPFLNSVVNVIYHLENQELNRYVGDYNNFLAIYEAKKQQVEAAYKRQQAEISNLKDFVARNKARAATANLAMSRQKKLDKMDIIEIAAERPKPEFNFKEARTSGKLIFETKELVIGYDEPLSRPLNLTMERGQKIALVGANGIGKTTLLRSILGEIKPISGSVERGEYQFVGYFEQEVKSENSNTCIDEIWNEFPHLSQAEVRAALAKCGLTRKHIESKISVLSGGEKAKVRLCKLMNRESNVLVFDEPTNHLDVDAKEELKRALKAYKGSILLISHEPEFYQAVVNEVWNVESWTTKSL